MLALLSCSLVLPAFAADSASFSTALPWWIWPSALFVVCFLLGIVAVPAGVGGGVLFVPIVGGFFPFHLDFVRGAGLLVAMASALAAAPNLMRHGLADVRLALPLMLVASLTSIAGALVGLALPASVVNVALGCTIIAIVLLMVVTRRSEEPHGVGPDRLSEMLALHGVFVDLANGRRVAWTAHRTVTGLALFSAIGFLGGVFGVGAGWANVPVLNLVMALPLKIAAGTSGLILTSASASATWMYLNAGAMLPLIAVPSTIGMMLGARIGAHLLSVLKASMVRRLVIVLLLFAGGRAILKGLGIWI